MFQAQNEEWKLSQSEFEKNLIIRINLKLIHSKGKIHLGMSETSNVLWRVPSVEGTWIWTTFKVVVSQFELTWLGLTWLDLNAEVHNRSLWTLCEYLKISSPTVSVYLTRKKVLNPPNVIRIESIRMWNKRQIIYWIKNTKKWNGWR